MSESLQRSNEASNYTETQVLDKTIELLKHLDTSDQKTITTPLCSENYFLETGELAEYGSVELPVQSSRNTTSDERLHPRRAVVRLSRMHAIESVDVGTGKIKLDASETSFRATFMLRDIVGGYPVQISTHDFTAEKLLSDKNEDLNFNLGSLLIAQKDPNDLKRPAVTTEAPKQRTTTRRFVKGAGKTALQTPSTLS